MENMFFNRELSWLEFNARVLQQGLNKENPLLERLQFLSIVTSNFDEFFQVRVAAAKRALAISPTEKDESLLKPAELLSKISIRAHQIFQQQQDCLTHDILPKLSEKNLEYINSQNYSLQQKDYLSEIFQNEIFPLLTPLRTDTEVFPHIINLRKYVAFLLKPIAGIKNSSAEFKGNDDKARIALVEIPETISSIIWLPTKSKKMKQFTIIDDVVQHFGTNLFPGFLVEETLHFKVARDADFAVDEEAGKNFIHAMENVLIQRKSSFPVQMTCNNSSKIIKEFLKEKLELNDDDVYIIDNFLSPSDLSPLRENQDEKDMVFDKWEHFYPSDLPEDEVYWDTLKMHDKILHVPYESYDPVVKFIKDASNDENVLAIKMTLYRTGQDSPIISALINAAQQGKQVLALVELKARFDEERNIAWANKLEEASVTVIYGLVNLKVHAKILMVIRKENDTLRRYVHLATGNYNPKTANLYSDISLFTSNQQIANDATMFFNLVTGYSTLQNMNYLGMAPVSLKNKLLAMIQREIDRSTPEQPGLIIAKMNSLTHPEIIKALYKASQAGVKIKLNIRGICMLIPGVKGKSENITVTSIIDRYLEHARIFYFQNAASPELYCSSADWMSRNLDRRIELMFPIIDKNAFSEVKSILDSYFMDNKCAMELKSDGNWLPVIKEKNQASFRAQTALYKKYKSLNDNKKTNKDKQFIVRRK